MPVFLRALAVDVAHLCAQRGILFQFEQGLLVRRAVQRGVLGRLSHRGPDRQFALPELLEHLGRRKRELDLGHDAVLVLRDHGHHRPGPDKPEAVDHRVAVFHARGPVFHATLPLRRPGQESLLSGVPGGPPELVVRARGPLFPHLHIGWAPADCPRGATRQCHDSVEQARQLGKPVERAHVVDPLERLDVGNVPVVQKRRQWAKMSRQKHLAHPMASESPVANAFCCGFEFPSSISVRP